MVNTYLKNIKPATIVRLIVLAISIINLFASIVCDYRIPGLSQAQQEQLAVLISVVVSVISYWYNNSWSANATTADKVLQVIKNAEMTADDMDTIVSSVQNGIDSIKYGTPKDND